MKTYLTFVMIVLVFALAINTGDFVEDNDDAQVTGIGARICGNLNGGGWDVDLGNPPPTRAIASYCAYLFETGVFW